MRVCDLKINITIYGNPADLIHLQSFHINVKLGSPDIFFFFIFVEYDDDSTSPLSRLWSLPHALSFPQRKFGNVGLHCLNWTTANTEREELEETLLWSANRKYHKCAGTALKFPHVQSP